METILKNKNLIQNFPMAQVPQTWNTPMPIPKASFSCLDLSSSWLNSFISMSSIAKARTVRMLPKHSSATAVARATCSKMAMRWQNSCDNLKTPINITNHLRISSVSPDAELGGRGSVIESQEQSLPQWSMAQPPLWGLPSGVRSCTGRFHTQWSKRKDILLSSHNERLKLTVSKYNKSLLIPSLIIPHIYVTMLQNSLHELVWDGLNMCTDSSAIHRLGMLSSTMHSLLHSNLPSYLHLVLPFWSSRSLNLYECPEQALSKPITSWSMSSCF